MHQVSIEEAEHTLSSLIKNVIEGDEVFITQDEKPVVKIISVLNNNVSSLNKIKAGSAKGLIKIADDFDEPLEDFNEYM